LGCIHIADINGHYICLIKFLSTGKISESQAPVANQDDALLARPARASTEEPIELLGSNENNTEAENTSFESQRSNFHAFESLIKQTLDLAHNLVGVSFILPGNSYFNQDTYNIFYKAKIDNLILSLMA